MWATPSQGDGSRPGQAREGLLAERRRTRFVGAVTLGSAVLLSAGWAISAVWPGSAGFVVDEAGLQLVRARLDTVRVELDELPAPPLAVSASPAQVFGCGRDSGDLFQPALDKEWTLTRSAVSDIAGVSTPGAARAQAALVQNLKAAGWIDNDASNLDADEVQSSLYKDFDGFRITIGTGLSLNGLFVMAVTDPEVVCTERDQY